MKYYFIAYIIGEGDNMIISNGLIKGQHPILWAKEYSEEISMKCCLINWKEIIKSEYDLI